MYITRSGDPGLPCAVCDRIVHQLPADHFPRSRFVRHQQRQPTIPMAVFPLLDSTRRRVLLAVCDDARSAWRNRESDTCPQGSRSARTNRKHSRACSIERGAQQVFSGRYVQGIARSERQRVRTWAASRLLPLPRGIRLRQAVSIA